MYKKELINEIAQRGGFKKNEVKQILETELSVMEEVFKKSEEVSLIGFGTFTVKSRKPHTIVNPATHKRMNIPARKVVCFKPGVKLSLD
jgi:DNA-binding protein HU-beta